MVRANSTQQEPKKLLRITSMMPGGKPKSKDGMKHKCKESDIKKIVEMGFTRDQAITALVQNDQNLVMAINCLTK
jgi:NACalpha-BTF3-like transcription factor